MCPLCRNRTTRSFVLAAICLLALAQFPACTSGGGTPIAPLTVAVAVPAELVAGAAATWTAAITGGTAPYMVAWDFGAGAVPSTVTSTVAGGTATATVTMVNESVTL